MTTDFKVGDKLFIPYKNIMTFEVEIVSEFYVQGEKFFTLLDLDADPEDKNSYTTVKESDYGIERKKRRKRRKV